MAPDLCTVARSNRKTYATYNLAHHCWFRCRSGRACSHAGRTKYGTHHDNAAWHRRWRCRGISRTALFQAGTGLGLPSGRVHHVSDRRRHRAVSLDAIGAGGIELELKIRDFASDEEVRELVRAFEGAMVLPSQFQHCAHIAVALNYLGEASLEDATKRMRAALRNFTQRHGVNVYHETVTCFWMKLLDHLATTHYREMPLWRRINLIVERWAATDPVAVHYSRNVINSHAARESWIAPDRLPLPF